LSSRIFWDADFDMGQHFLDAEPEECRVKLQEMGIDPDYFLAVAPDPPDEQLDQIRQQLLQLTGRPEREEDKSYPGFEDSYNGLLVGPCDEGMLAAEIDCPWIGGIEMCGGGDGFDCTYEQWVKLFRDETRQASTLPVDPVVLTADQKAQARAADETGKPINLEGGSRIELREDGWVVIGEHGDFLIDVEKSCWCSKDEPDLPALRWPTPEEGLTAWVRAEGIAAARSARHDEAIRRLCG
jgi:hypothetical protein